MSPWQTTRKMGGVEVRSSRLVRRKDGRIVAGVAAGLADQNGVAALWVRLAFALLAFFFGLGIVIYVLLWLLIPREDLPASAAQRLVQHYPDAPTWLGVGLLVVGSAMLATHLGTFGWSLLLIGLGVVLFRRNTDRGHALIPARAEQDGDPLEVALPDRVDRPVRRQRERSWLGWLSFGAALFAAGTVALVRSDAGSSPALSWVFAVPLGILGLGLLVGAFAGRARWTIPFGLLLIPFALLVAVFPVSPFGPWSDQQIFPRSAGDLAPRYEMAGPRFVLDLSRLPYDELIPPISAVIGAGEVLVRVPEGRGVQVVGSAGVGVVDLQSRSIAGVDVTDTWEIRGPSPIELDLEVGFGRVVVSMVEARGPARPPGGQR